MKIRKAVIPAAGLGTRMFPASKAVPKELLPVMDRPMLHHVVKEAVDAGLTQIIIVTSRGKEAMADYFAPAPELEAAVTDARARQGLAEVRRLSQAADFLYVRQEEQRGLGHAVLMARVAVGDEPFAVLLPDTLVVGQGSAIGQLQELATRLESSAIAVQEVAWERVSSFGVIASEPPTNGAYRVLGLVEKPPQDKAPSNLALVGRYILTSQIFDELARVPRGAGGEIQLTDGIAALLKHQPVFACRLEGTWYDTGTPFGLLQASVEVALRQEETRTQAQSWLISLASSFKPGTRLA